MKPLVSLLLFACDVAGAQVWGAADHDHVAGVYRGQRGAGGGGAGAGRAGRGEHAGLGLGGAGLSGAVEPAVLLHRRAGRVRRCRCAGSACCWSCWSRSARR